MIVLLSGAVMIGSVFAYSFFSYRNTEEEKKNDALDCSAVLDKLRICENIDTHKLNKIRFFPDWARDIETVSKQCPKEYSRIVDSVDTPYVKLISFGLLHRKSMQYPVQDDELASSVFSLFDDVQMLDPQTILNHSSALIQPSV